MLRNGDVIILKIQSNFMNGRFPDKGGGENEQCSVSRLQDQFPFRKTPIQLFSGQPSVATHCEGHRTLLKSLQRRSGCVLRWYNCW